MNGPFQTERDTAFAPLALLVTGAHDQRARLLVAARLRTLGRLAPRGHRLAAAGGSVFPAAERMVGRGYGHAEHSLALAQPAVAVSLAGCGGVRVAVVCPRD